MDKPICVRIEELRAGIEEVVHKSGLPPSVLEPIFFQIHQNLNALKTQEYAQAMEIMKKEVDNNGSTNAARP